MPLAPGTRFGPYEILAPIGAGGTRDGQRFVIGTLLDAPNATRPIAIVVLNWTADLK